MSESTINAKRNWMQILNAFLLICLVVSLASCGTESNPPTNYHPFAGGAGTPDDPFQIATVEQLQAIDDTLWLDKHFVQVQDIDASASADFQKEDHDIHEFGFIPIGTYQTPFTGSFDGNAFRITDLILNMYPWDPHVGTFGFIQGAVIKNVTIENPIELNVFSEKQESIKFQEMIAGKINDNLNENHLTDKRALGFLVGYNSGGTIENCRLTVDVRSRFVSYSGGMVGINAGVISNSKVNGYVAILATSGGLVGLNTGTVMDSFSEGVVSSQVSGGLVGSNLGEIINSYSKADLGSGNLHGGLVARNYGVVKRSFSMGVNIDDSYGSIGGLVGINQGLIENSYSQTTLSAFKDNNEGPFVGGLVAENVGEGMIKSSYSVTLFNVPMESIVAGVVSINRSLLNDTYWDIDISQLEQAVGEGSPEGATGLSTAQITGPAAEQNMPEFDWVNIWRTTEDGYPVLRWEEE